MSNSGYRIVTERKWSLTGFRHVRRIEGEPSFEALKAWMDGGDIHAPSIEWLKAALEDTVARVLAK
jgi:hypothetical protein